MLKPLRTQSTATVERGSDSPSVQCEACGLKLPRHDAINIIICIGSPGHMDLPPFQCEHTEHWACSRECWLKVAHACIDEHMHELLKQSHEKVGR